MTKLEFRVRPPAEVNADVSQTVAIDCTASVAPGLSLVYTQWVMPLLCGETPEQPDVLPNGTLVISQITMQNMGVYTCMAYTQEETISASVYLHVSSSRVYAGFVCNYMAFVIVLSHCS